MKKRLSALLLAALLLTTTALAAPDSAENFVRGKTYAGEFSDLTPENTFYSNVTALYEYGLSAGKADGTFGLQDLLTVSQAVIFAGRIRSLYRIGDAESGAAAHQAEGLAVYEPYLRYLQAEGLLGSELDGTYATAATRAQMAHVLAPLLPPEALPLMNEALVAQCYASRRYITDVTEYTPYYQDILTLYRTGVSMGGDATGSFLPERGITRGAAAAMLTRMVDPALRVTPAWDPEGFESATGKTLGGLVPPGEYVAAPATEEQMDSSVRYMLSRGEHILALQYDEPVSAVVAQKLMKQALHLVKSYCEQSYNNVSCTYGVSGTVTLTFSAASAGTELSKYRERPLAAAIAVHDQLWESGRLTNQMTETEKARVYFDWICNNCVYDYQADDRSLSHIPYSLFETGQAVCDGYTGAYNLLLKLEGIQCTALSNEDHIWTLAVLDGVQVHIDTTWGDSGSTPDYGYFAMTPEVSWGHHAW